jgi:16S rRNA U516 pseudouridylate synthase RsuA-like enzyme
MSRPDAANTSERLQKYLSGLGLGSRRKIEEWIEQGKITVNGKVASLGDKVTREKPESIPTSPTTCHFI